MEQRIENLIKEMILEEKVSMIAGGDGAEKDKKYTQKQIFLWFFMRSW